MSQDQDDDDKYLYGNNEDSDEDDDLEIVLDTEAKAEKVEQKQEVLGLPIPRQDGSAQPKGVDINQVGKYDGVDIFDVDLDTFEDKPWRKPGADITDYFNFGFDENTWKAYCNKQKAIRDEISMHMKLNPYQQDVKKRPREGDSRDGSPYRRREPSVDRYKDSYKSDYKDDYRDNYRNEYRDYDEPYKGDYRDDYGYKDEYKDRYNDYEYKDSYRRERDRYEKRSSRDHSRNPSRDREGRL